MNAADDRCDVMLAVRFEPDVAQQDHFIVASDFLEGAVKIFAGIFEVAGKPFFVGANNAGRRATQAFPVRVIPGPLDERSHSSFGRCSRRPFVLATRTFCRRRPDFMLNSQPLALQPRAKNSATTPGMSRGDLRSMR